MTNHQSSRHRSTGAWMVARLQCFARYAEDAGEERLPLVRVHELSLENIVTQAVPDLRAGAIVRLLIPAVGWRHLEVQWARRGMACYQFLLPLMPHELRAVLDAAPIDRADPPRARRPHAAAHASRATPRRGQHRTIHAPMLPDIRTAGQALIAMLAQCAATIFALPVRTA